MLSHYITQYRVVHIQLLYRYNIVNISADCISLHLLEILKDILINTDLY